MSSLSEEDIVDNGVKVIAGLITEAHQRAALQSTSSYGSFLSDRGQASPLLAAASAGISGSLGATSNDPDPSDRRFTTRGWALQQQLNAAREQHIDSPEQLLANLRSAVKTIHAFNSHAEQCVQSRILTLMHTRQLQRVWAAGPPARGVEDASDDPDMNPAWIEQGICWNEDGVNYFILNHPVVLHYWAQALTVAGSDASPLALEARLAKAVHAEVKCRNRVLRSPMLYAVAQVPLCASFEFLGALVFCEVDLGLSRSTLVHGVFSTVARQFGAPSPTGQGLVAALMNRAFDFITRTLAIDHNLRPQSVGASTVHLNAATQGHIGVDGVCYLRNLHRMLPPLIGGEPQGTGLGPPPPLSSETHSINETACRRMREEFIARYLPSTVMKADAWMRQRSGAPDPQDLEVLSASAAMHKRALPELVDLLAVLDALIAFGDDLGMPEADDPHPPQSTASEGSCVATNDQPVSKGAGRFLQAAAGIRRTKRTHPGLKLEPLSDVAVVAEIITVDDDPMSPSAVVSANTTLTSVRGSTGKPNKNSSLRVFSRKGTTMGSPQASSVSLREPDHQLPAGLRVLRAAGSTATEATVASARAILAECRSSAAGRLLPRDISALLHRYGVNICFLGAALQLLEELLDSHDRTLAGTPGFGSPSAASVGAAAASVPSPLARGDGPTAFGGVASAQWAATKRLRRHSSWASRVAHESFITRHPVIVAMRHEMISRAARHVLNAHWRRVACALPPSGELSSAAIEQRLRPFAESTVDMLMRVSGDGLSYMNDADRTLWEAELIPAVEMLFDYHHFCFFRAPHAEQRGGGGIGQGAGKNGGTVGDKAGVDDESVIVGGVALRRPKRNARDAAALEARGIVEPHPISLTAVKTTSWGAVADADLTVGAVGAPAVQRYGDIDVGDASDVTAATGLHRSGALGGRKRSVKLTASGGQRAAESGPDHLMWNPLAAYTVSNEHSNGVLPSVAPAANPGAPGGVRFCAQQHGDLVARICELTNVKLIRAPGRTITGFWVEFAPKVTSLRVASPFTPEQMRAMSTGDYHAVDAQLQGAIKDVRKTWSKQGSTAGELHAEGLLWRAAVLHSCAGRFATAIEYIARLRQCVLTDVCHSELGVVSLQLQQARCENARKRHQDAIEIATAALHTAEEHLQRTKLVPTAMIALLDAIDAADISSMAMRQRKQDLIARLVPACRRLLLPVGHVLAREAIVGKLLHDQRLAANGDASAPQHAPDGRRPLSGIASISGDELESQSVDGSGSGSPSLNTSNAFNDGKLVSGRTLLPPSASTRIAPNAHLELQLAEIDAHTNRLRDALLTAVSEQGCRAPEIVYFVARYCAFCDCVAMLPTAVKALALYVPLSSPYLRQGVMAVVEYAVHRLSSDSERGRGGIGLHISDLSRMQWVDVADPIAAFQIVRDAASDGVHADASDSPTATADILQPLGGKCSFAPTFAQLQIAGKRIGRQTSSFVPADVFSPISMRQQHWIIFNSTAYLMKRWVDAVLRAVPQAHLEVPWKWDLGAMMAFAEIVDSIHALGVADPALGIAINSVIVSRLKPQSGSLPSALLLPFYTELAVCTDAMLQKQRSEADSRVSLHNWKDALRPMEAFVESCRALQAIVRVARDAVHTVGLAAAASSTHSIIGETPPSAGASARIHSRQLFPVSLMPGSLAPQLDDLGGGGGGDEMRDVVGGDGLPHLSPCSARLVSYAFSIEEGLVTAGPAEDRTAAVPTRPLSALERDLLLHIRHFKHLLGDRLLSDATAVTDRHRQLRVPMWEATLRCFTELHALEAFLFAPLHAPTSLERTKAQLEESIWTLTVICDCGPRHVGAVDGQAAFLDTLRATQLALQEVIDDESATLRELDRAERERTARARSATQPQHQPDTRAPTSSPHRATITPQQTSLSPLVQSRLLGVINVALGVEAARQRLLPPVYSTANGSSSRHDSGSRSVSSSVTPQQLPLAVTPPRSGSQQRQHRSAEELGDKTPLHMQQEARRPPPGLTVTPAETTIGKPVSVSWTLPKLAPPSHGWIGIFPDGVELRRCNAITVLQGLKVRRLRGTEPVVDIPHRAGRFVIAYFYDAAGPPLGDDFVKRVTVHEFMGRMLASVSHTHGCAKASDESAAAIGAAKNDSSLPDMQQHPAGSATVTVSVAPRSWIPFDTKRASHERLRGLKQRDQIERHWLLEARHEMAMETIGRSQSAVLLISNRASDSQPPARLPSPARKAKTPLLGETELPSPQAHPSTTLPLTVKVRYVVDEASDALDEQRRRYKKAVASVASKNKGAECFVVDTGTQKRRSSNFFD